MEPYQTSAAMLLCDRIENKLTQRKGGWPVAYVVVADAANLPN